MTTAQKTKVTPSWDVTKVREAAAGVAVKNVVTGITFAEKFGPEAVKQYAELWTNNKIEYLKTHNVKTPLELVKASAEFEANVFGSVVVFWGEENNATVTYEVCGCFEACKREGLMSPELGQKFESFFSNSSQQIAKAFGFTVTTECGKDEMPIITYKK